MPKKLTREERLARRRKLMSSPQSLNGRILTLEREILERAVNQGLGVKAIARRLRIGVKRARLLLKKHGLRVPTQPEDSKALNELNQRRHEEKLARLAARQHEADSLAAQEPMDNSLSHLARLLKEPEKVNEASIESQPPIIGSQGAAPAVRPSPKALAELTGAIITGRKHPGCNHPVRMDSVTWLTPEVFVCARCNRPAAQGECAGVGESPSNLNHLSQ